MTPISVVIICRNAAATIEKVLQAAFLLTDDVIVMDSGSTDGTQELVSGKARLITTRWEGFGPTKNRGNKEAKYNWILSIDADEVISGELIASIQAVEFTSIHMVYAMKRLNYVGGRPVHYSGWQNDWVKRLFNRRVTAWDGSPVHENLVLTAESKIKKLNGTLHHYTTNSITDYEHKLESYATLMAEKYFSKGRKATLITLYLSPAFNFIKNYFFHLGFMDKKTGWQIAWAHAQYTFRKYKKLKILNKWGKQRSGL